MTMTDMAFIACCVAGGFYAMARAGYGLTRFVFSLTDRAFKTRLHRAAEVVCDEMEKIAGRQAGTIVVNSSRYHLQITVKPGREYSK